MRHTLVGYTGFVGGNLAAAHTFDGLYNSKNIHEAYGADNGLVVYSAMPSEKYLANADPAADLAQAKNALENIQKMRPEKLVLISTVDVYPAPVDVYEDTPAGGENAPAYGANRYALEQWVRQQWPKALILRLPGLYGRGLKKNFIFDALTLTPTMLTEAKYRALSAAPLVAQSYEAAKPGFYKVKEMDGEGKERLRAFFARNDFNALNFTDSRSVFQFYDLSRLWADVEACLKAELPLVNLAAEPIEAGELYEAVFGKPFENHLDKPPARYDMRTRFDGILGGGDGYLQRRADVVAGVRALAGIVDKQE